jgi:hypothetical protein
MVIQAPAPPEKVDRDDLSLLDLFVGLNRQAPNPFVGGGARNVTVTGIVEPAALGLVDAPGSKGAPLACGGLG